MYIVEIATRTGNVCETFATYDEALHRVNQFPAESLTGLPLIFKELPDGSQRLVRLDGKPLQWHRLPEDLPPGPEEPILLCEAVSRTEEICAAADDEPLPLLDLPPEFALRQGPSIRVVWVKSEGGTESMDEIG